MARTKELKRRIIITSNGLDFPCGFAPNAQGKELGQALIGLGFDPLMVPQKLSSFPDGEASGTYFGIPYDYLCDTRRFAGGIRNPFFGKVLSACFSVVASLRLSFYLIRNRKTLAAVFDLSNQTLPLMIEGITCRLLGIPLVYFLWEEVCAHRVNRQSSKSMKWVHRLIALVEAPLLYGIALRFPCRITYLTVAAYDYLRKWGYSNTVLCDFPVVKYQKPVQRPLDRPQHGFDLVFTGTINCEKDDFMTVVKAIAALKEEQPELRMRIYGSTEGSAREDILAVAEDYHVSDRVEFMGWYKLEDLDIVRREALALLVLKKNTVFNHYNFPSRILDFIDSGRPLLISDLPTHCKYFKDRHNAFVIEEGNIEQLIGAIQTIIENLDMVTSMTDAAAGLLDERFNADKHLRELLGSLKLLDHTADTVLV